MKWLENKYIALLSYRLEHFKKKNDNLFNFRCPFCGDSKTNKHRARGYLIEKKGSFWFHCHNCGESKGFSSFLRAIDLSLHNEYRMDCWREQNATTVAPVHEPITQKKYDDNVFSVLSRVSDLPDEHYAKLFVRGRKLPSKYHSMLFFAPKYQTFVNNIIPDKLPKPDSPRLVIPFCSYGKEVVGFQGRALDDNPIRYSYVVIDYDLPRAFGLPDVNYNKRYYVLEGPLDSMFLDNAIAIGGSDLVGGLRRLGCPRDNATIIFDNECRNSEIVAKQYAAIRDKYSVVIWPSDLPYKDVNDMILGGFTAAEVQHLIDQNTYCGLPAELAFNTWKRT